MTAPIPTNDPISLPRLLVKTLVLFLILNVVFALSDPLPFLGKISAYNLIFPGRVRLPYGEHPEAAYNFSLSNLDAMFASHEIAARSKPANEYRIIILGDSSIWGYLLPPDQTISARINARHIVTSDGRSVRVYNLGYPTLSILKDLMLMRYALGYQPDLIIWATTLESFPLDKQASSPLVQENLSTAAAVYPGLQASPTEPSVWRNAWQRSLIGRRRELADLARLQVYGFLWASTGVDQYYPTKFDPPENDLANDATFHGQQPPALNPDLLAWGVLDAGVRMAGPIPILFANEPIYLANGANSDVRYNFFYPRWAYDQYRKMFAARASLLGWRYLDAWDLVPPAAFTNSSIHLSPEAEDRFAEQLAHAIKQFDPLPSKTAGS
jgi:hypothetical protein